MSTLGSEQGRAVLVNEERPPVLYDAKGRSLVRPVGFRSSETVPAGDGKA